MKILLGPEYVSDEDEPDSEDASEGEQEDARDTFVDRTTVTTLLYKYGALVFFLVLCRRISKAPRVTRFRIPATMTGEAIVN